MFYRIYFLLIILCIVFDWYMFYICVKVKFLLIKVLFIYYYVDLFLFKNLILKSSDMII